MSLHVLLIEVRVLPESVEAFKEATLANARASRLEPGLVRFDVVQDVTDPTRLAFVEAYRGPEAHAEHRKTAHYLAWRDAVAPMMAEPRAARTFASVDPEDAAW